MDAIAQAEDETSSAFSISQEDIDDALPKRRQICGQQVPHLPPTDPGTGIRKKILRC